MIKVKQLIDGKWDYSSTANLQENDIVNFSCNGKGRGGHYGVTAVVTKINKKTFNAIESKGSYCPGTHWRINLTEENLFIQR